MKDAEAVCVRTQQHQQQQEQQQQQLKN